MSSEAGSLSFERIADRFDETRGGEDRGRRFAVRLTPELDRTRPVLEVGIGTGLVALGLTELGHRVVGIDLSKAMASRAVARIGPRVALGDAGQLPVADAAFDQAYSVWLLHVVGDPARVLSEVGRVLAPGGRYLVVPARNSEASADPIGRALSAMWLRVDPRGRRSDDEARLRDLAAAAGLRVVEARVWPEHDYLESPAQAIAKIRSRSYSVLWDLPEDGWEALVEPTLRELQSLPRPEVPIERRSSDRLIIMERPG